MEVYPGIEYKQVEKINDEMSLARNEPDEFFRILRKAFKGKNANTETYGRNLDYLGNEVTPEYFRKQYEKLQNVQFRLQPKNDQNKTNITDSPGFGSVRLSPPYEEQDYDRLFHEFCCAIVEENDTVVDFGGGFSPFLAFIPRGNKKLVDKTGLVDTLSPFGISYEQSDEWIKKPIDPNTVVFCWHTLEHADNPEELLQKLSTADVFVFATPNEELINTSIYHHVFMQVSVFKSQFVKNNSIAFLRRSKNGLDIHGVVINSPTKWNNLIKNNIFFNKNFTLFSEIQ